MSGGFAMMGHSGPYDAATHSNESRPKMIINRLTDLERRLSALLMQADNAAILFSGQSVLQPTGQNVAEKPPSMGLYSDIFMCLDRLNDLCSLIEQALQEATR